MPEAFYRLKVPTMAVTFLAGQRLITIPAGESVRVDVDDLRIGGNVRVRWEGRMVTMFAIDLMERAEKVSAPALVTQ